MSSWSMIAVITLYPIIDFPHLDPLDTSGKWVKKNKTIYIGLYRGAG